MARIIPIIKFLKPTRPLSSLMIKTLREACEKQSQNIPFGQDDLDGSFMALLRRKFIDTDINLNNKSIEETKWYVTQAGKDALKNLGIDDPC